MATLVFPSSTPEGESYIQDAVSRGEAVVAASSFQAREQVHGLPDHYLPLIHDDRFEAALMSLVQDHGIERIFSPSALVYVHLRTLIGRKSLPLSFVAMPPFYQEMERQREEHKSAVEDIAAAHELLGSDDYISAPELQAVLRTAFGIFGESYRYKLVALSACAYAAPPGDFIEIGCLYGRSCSVIVQTLKMAGRSDAVLAIDAWESAAARQTSLTPELADEGLSLDLSTIADAFDVNLLPLVTAGQFNRLRLPSQTAHGYYGEGASITTETFGTTSYVGQISFLHIDANHDYDAVKLDCDLWCPMVRPGGWIVFDDYNWRHGAGPGQVADEFCEARRDDIARSFFIDGALFINLKDEAA